MTDKTLVERVAREIQASQKTSETPAGQSKPSAPAEAMAATINQVFALFRLNYHNQYYAAYPDDSQLKQVKKLWLDALSDFDPELILRGAKSALENSEYLPTLNRMLDACRAQAADAGLPPAHDAFVEACSARTPRSAQLLETLHDYVGKTKQGAQSPKGRICRGHSRDSRVFSRGLG